MIKNKKLRYSLATYYQEEGESPCCDLTELAEVLAKGPGHIPERLNLTKATELFHLGRAFLAMEKRLMELDEKEKQKKSDDKFIGSLFK